MASYRADSEVDICNQALGLIQQGSIVALDQAHSTAARTCKTYYAITRDRLLADYRWNFNTERSSFPAVTVPTFGFRYAYAKPATCLRVLSVDGCEQDDWTIEGEHLLTDRAAPLYARWLKRVTEPRLFSAHFLDLLAHEIAIKLAPSLARQRGIANDVAERADLLRRSATRADASEGRERLAEFRSSLIAARRV